MKIADDSSALQKYFLKTLFLSTNREGWVRTMHEVTSRFVAQLRRIFD